MQGLWQTAAPASGTIASLIGGEIARRVHDASVLVYCVRQIITAEAIRAPGGFRQRAAEIAQKVKRNAGAIAETIDSGRRRSIIPIEEIGRMRAEAVMNEDKAKLLPMEWFDRIDRVIADMANSIGVGIEHP